MAGESYAQFEARVRAREQRIATGIARGLIFLGAAALIAALVVALI